VPVGVSHHSKDLLASQAYLINFIPGLGAESQTGMQVGEIVTRGPHVMLGYHGDPGATAAARLPGGWLRTGDVGRVDRTGCLWLLGRIKDTVRSGSENVNAAAVERVLLQVGLMCFSYLCSLNKISP
jgi:acyl-CoA synthetase (AMP-forming)/AMP-acid ligase II